MSAQRDVDDYSGVETTGHQWDGIKELNKPLPRWWLYVLYACIVWAVGYWVAYPAFPLLSGYSRGVLGYSSRSHVTQAITEGKQAQSTLNSAIAGSSLAQIEASPELLAFAAGGGRAAFANNCAGCHGRGAQGSVGYPNLVDDNWMWGGSLDAI